MNVGLFLGRFHPVIVHLPIGFLLLAVILEIYARYVTEKKIDQAISFSFLLGFITGLFAIILGFFISSEGGYDDRLLNLHRVAGIGMTGLSFLCWMIKSGKLRTSKPSYRLLTSFLTLMIIMTGHFGGMLTHGKDYLISNAPAFIRTVFNHETKQRIYSLPSTPDSLIVYEHIIQPVLDNKCNVCHNPMKSKSGLVLNSYENLMKGGERGNVIEAGYPFQSELFKRVTLPSADIKFMPPKGPPLSYGETQLLFWWIKEGASESASLNNLKVPDDIKQILQLEFDYDASPRSFVEVYPVNAPEKDHLNTLGMNHFKTRFLSKNSSFLDIRSKTESIEIKNIEVLHLVSEQVTWLDLRNSGITDEMLVMIGDLSNLTKLRLDGNPVTEKGISFLEDLEHLEMISLYQTDVGKECLRSLIKLPRLKKIYLGRTRINQKDISEIENIRDDLEIISDLQFSESVESYP